MSTWLFTHAACIAHDPGTYHPERPDRLRAALAALEAEPFVGLEWQEAPRARVAMLERVH